MKFIFQLTALAAALACVAGAPASSKNTTGRVLVKFCQDKAGKICTKNYSIFEEENFKIPEGYKYEVSVFVPTNEAYFTLIQYESKGGDVAACNILVTDVEYGIINKHTRSPGGSSVFSTFPGQLGKACANGKCVKCSIY